MIDDLTTRQIGHLCGRAGIKALTLGALGGLWWAIGRCIGLVLLVSVSACRPFANPLTPTIWTVSQPEVTGQPGALSLKCPDGLVWDGATCVTIGSRDVLIRPCLPDRVCLR